MADTEAGGEILIEDHALSGGFVQIPVVVMFDGEITAGAKVSYGLLLWYAWRDRRFPGQKAMAEDLGSGERTVRRHLAELEEAGYIEVQQLGLGRPNRYLIKTLQGREIPDRPKVAGLGGQKWPVKAANNGRSHTKGLDLTTQDSLSHTEAPELAVAFFDAIGEGKPSEKRRERALQIINDLTAEGFDVPTIREAIRLAGERGARGPDLLPHVVGEAHERILARGKRKARAAEITALDEGQQQAAAEQFSEELQAVEALPMGERARLEQECRERLPVGISEGMARAVLPGMIAARLREAAG